MSKILEELKKKLDSMTQEELDEEWERLKHYNEIGPTVDEYFEWINNSAKNKIKIADKEIHDMETSGTWTKNKQRYRELKKISKYWKDYLKQIQ